MALDVYKYHSQAPLSSQQSFTKIPVALIKSANSKRPTIAGSNDEVAESTTEVSQQGDLGRNNISISDTTTTKNTVNVNVNNNDKNSTSSTNSAIVNPNNSSTTTTANNNDISKNGNDG